MFKILLLIHFTQRVGIINNANGCNSMYCYKLNKEVLWIHSDRCWSNRCPCSWAPFLPNAKPDETEDVQHFKLESCVKNEEFLWPSILQDMKPSTNEE